MAILDRLRRARRQHNAHEEAEQKADDRRITRQSRAEVESPHQPGEPDADLTPHSAFDRAVPRGLQVAGAWAWRLIAIAVVVWGLGYALRHLSEVTIPVVIAILLAAMLYPATRQLGKWGLPHGAAVGVSLVGGILIVLGVLGGIVAVIANGYDEIAARSTAGAQQLIDWLNSGPLKVDQTQIDGWLESVKQFLIDSKATIAEYAASIGASVGHFFAGLAICLFSLIYFLHDGRRIWLFLLNFIPSAARRRADVAGRHGWNSLVHYVRATVMVAAVDAIGALIGALILGVPMAPALAALIFLGAFIPLVGAFVSGFVAVAVALVTLGWVKAVIMLAIIVGVMFLEGHILQPFLLGKAVSVHPLAVLLGIAVGVIIGGIVGALIAVPVIAFSKVFIQSLAAPDGVPVHAD